MDAHVVEELYLRFGGLVYRRCLRMLKDPCEAENAVQEVFLRIIRTLEKGTKVEAMRNYLFRTATNYCLNRLRSQKRRPPHVPIHTPLPEGRPGPEQQLSTLSVLEECMARLDGDKRLVVYLYFGEGMTQEEVAEIAGLSRRTVGKVLRSFRKRVQGSEKKGRSVQ